jgi:hypothetical protein
VLLTTNAAALRTICAHIEFDDPVAIYPLPLHDCECLVARRLGDSANDSDVVQIAELSEGNPLAVSLFTNEFIAARDRGDENPWQAIGGSLTEYYRRVWNRFPEGSAAHYLLAVIARLRGAVYEDELVQMLTACGRGDATDFLEQTRHLFDPFSDTIRFYHDSLREFVVNTTQPVDAQIHGALARYCDESQMAALSKNPELSGHQPGHSIEQLSNYRR